LSFIDKINNGIDIPIQNCNKFLNEIMIDSFVNQIKNRNILKKVTLKLAGIILSVKKAYIKAKNRYIIIHSNNNFISIKLAFHVYIHQYVCQFDGYVKKIAIV
jgi:hypothetical protein